jgi:metal-sulfur cluster biosynthetic enzyme
MTVQKSITLVMSDEGIEMTITGSDCPFDMGLTDSMGAAIDEVAGTGTAKVNLGAVGDALYYQANFIGVLTDD